MLSNAIFYLCDSDYDMRHYVRENPSHAGMWVRGSNVLPPGASYDLWEVYSSFNFFIIFRLKWPLIKLSEYQFAIKLRVIRCAQITQLRVMISRQTLVTMVVKWLRS